MKRSEMIAKIKEVISYEIGPAFATQRTAEELLKEIEKCMKPPLEKRCPVLLRPTHTWEKESHEQNT